VLHHTGKRGLYGIRRSRASRCPKIILPNRSTSSSPTMTAACSQSKAR
jgi:hypothetical protein